MNFSKFKELTRWEQSFFGLPIVFAGLFLPFCNPQFLMQPFFWRRIGWVLPAFFAARISGMAFNQWIDRHIDARNPRTKERLLPRGQITSWQVILTAWGSLVAFLLFCSQINFLTVFFALFAAFLLMIYSYIKRVSVACHFVLGMIHLLAPIMASIAITGKWEWPSFYLGLASFCSIVANDIFYALQDYKFDCKEGLYSIPSRLGEKNSLKIARIFHVGCIGCLICVGFVASFHWICYIVPLFLSGYLLYFYIYAAFRSVKKEMLFFLTTVVTSFSFLIFIVLGVLWHVM